MKYEITRELLAQIFGSRKHVCNAKYSFMGYKQIVNNKEYAIYERPIKTDKIIAAYGDTIVKKRGNHTLIYIPNARIPWINYHIELNERNFPGLYSKSKISQCLLLPYLRRTKKDTYVKDIRLCVFTDKAQIFHNHPARGVDYEGLILPNDTVKFEESVVWDIPGKKYPSNNEELENNEYYYPGLPEQSYQFSPKDNMDAAYHDIYGNGGFGKTKRVINNGKEEICSRFYIHSKSEKTNPFLFIGTGMKNDKVNIIGTYRANVEAGVRICIFATSDGGREWFCKYEFSDMGEYEFQQGYSDKWGTNFGNNISVDINLHSEGNKINLFKRNIVLPESSDGEIETKFSWTQVAYVTDIIGGEHLIVRTKFPHGLKTGNIVSLQSNDVLQKESKWLICCGVNEQGTIDGLQFKVRVINDSTIELLELVSSSRPTLPCRHIHHINLHKDGWIVGTGEIYPNGWLLYIQQRMADTYSVVNASDQFQIARLNTKQDSVQRTMGLLIKDTIDSRVIFASDHDTLRRNFINSDSLHNAMRSSLGVFVGRLEDIDDRNKFECVYDASEPCYFFQQIGDMIVYAGQRGEIAICVDSDNKKWYQERIGRFIMHYFGQFHNFYCFNDYVILRK